MYIKPLSPHPVCFVRRSVKKGSKQKQRERERDTAKTPLSIQPLRNQTNNSHNTTHLVLPFDPTFLSPSIARRKITTPGILNSKTHTRHLAKEEQFDLLLQLVPVWPEPPPHHRPSPLRRRCRDRERTAIRQESRKGRKSGNKFSTNNLGTFWKE